MPTIDVFNTHRKRRVGTKAVEQYVRRVLRLGMRPKARISVVFVDSKYCRRMNKLYLQHDYATDVLSFPLENGRLLEGEIYVNLDRAKTQAREYGVSMNNEVARLVIHGTLHLVGYDDTTLRKARAMKAQEERHMQHWFH